MTKKPYLGVQELVKDIEEKRKIHQEYLNTKTTEDKIEYKRKQAIVCRIKNKNKNALLGELKMKIL